MWKYLLKVDSVYLKLNTYYVYKTLRVYVRLLLETEPNRTDKGGNFKIYSPF